MVARPTSARVRLAAMNLLADRLRGCRWLDACCGSGAVACEALQRGAAVVVAIERDPRVAALARQNLQAVAAGFATSRPMVTVHTADSLRWLVGGPQARQLDCFDIIYLDPPWSEGLHAPLTELIRRGGWLAAGGVLIWECPTAAVPVVPEGWNAKPLRHYGATTLMLLEPSMDPDPR
jgi:16S rRNA (guanine(966)-N(2))-methyltransferase RsmD